jgi:PEP-CTERM/exosortase A-associated glycosyltransferase
MSGKSSSPKILHVLYHSLPPQSGYAFRSHNILQAQSKRGWRVVAVTAPQAEQSSFTKPEERIGGFRYYRSGAVPRGAGLFGTERRLMRALTRRLREVVELEKPDVLHAHSPVLNAISTFRVAREVGIPVIYEIRAFWEDAAANHGSYDTGSRKYKLMQSLETRACHLADQIAVISHGIKNDLITRSIPTEKLTLAPNGVDVDHFKACSPDSRYLKAWRLGGKKIIGFIGSFFKYEGLDLLIEAMARLAETRSDVALLLVGGGRIESELRAQIEQLRLKDRVTMPGKIPHESIPAVYAMCDILAYPRYASRLTELTTPLKPLEAMAMGRGVIASDIGGHRELIQHGRTGLLFRAGDLSALVETLRCLLDNPAMCQELGLQASTSVQQTRSWDKIAATYADVYAKAQGQSQSQLTKSSVGLRFSPNKRALARPVVS